MMKRTIIAATLSLFAAAFMLQFNCNAQTNAQPTAQAEPQTELDERGTVKSEEFVNSRPSGKTPNAKTYLYRRRTGTGSSPKPAKTKKDAPASQLPSVAKGKVFVSLGITIGRGRPATQAELNDNSIAKAQWKCLEWREKDCIRREQMVVERISDTTPIIHGTPMQMMIEYLASKDAAGKIQESGRVGYLYVINRVEFKNKSLGAPKPKLIFPTRTTFGGDNRVLPGKTVMLPGPERLWQITRNKTAPQEFETYIIIISPKPLKDLSGKELQPGETPLELDEGLVNSWITQWGGAETQLELEQGTGQLLTQREQAAGGQPKDTSRDTEEIDADLNKSDPPPQLGFSKAVAPGDAMLVTIRLPFKETTATAAPSP